jgi:hypothetical protein
MSFGMGLNKNRHGTYEARKKVPAHLEGAVARVLGNGKPKQVWLKRSLATKDHSEAKRRVKAVQIEFDRILERARELLAERPLRDTISEAEVKLIADRHYAEMLHLDDQALAPFCGLRKCRAGSCSDPSRKTSTTPPVYTTVAG